jgi:putative addiction module component (TIGR02574 family)
MAINANDFGIDGLSVGERLELIQLLWDSLPPQVAPEDVPDWHRELLDQRLAEAEENPGGGVPWRDAIARLGAKP